LKKICFLVLLAVLVVFGCGRKTKVKENENVATQEPTIRKEEKFAFDEIKNEEENRVTTGSLWSNKNRISKYEDIKGRNIGDIIVIIISENASATQSSSDTRSKNANLKASAGTGLLNFLPAFGADGSSGFKDSDATRRSGSLTAMVSARIEKVDEYGNLYVVGKRNVLINKELQEIEISGYIRPQDIGINNSVESVYLADAEVKYKGKLVFDGKTKPGLISNVLGAIANFFF
jgi:flagellar L-ring protein FlgH